MRLVDVVTGTDYALDPRGANQTRLPSAGIIRHASLEVDGRRVSCPVNDNVNWAGAARPLYYVWIMYEGRARYVTLERPDELDGRKFAIDAGRAMRRNPPRKTSNVDVEAERIRKFQATMAKRKRAR